MILNYVYMTEKYILIPELTRRFSFTNDFSDIVSPLYFLRERGWGRIVKCLDRDSLTDACNDRGRGRGWEPDWEPQPWEPWDNNWGEDPRSRNELFWKAMDLIRKQVEGRHL